MKRPVSLQTRLRGLREAFDDSFAAPVREEPVAVDNFLALRLGKRAYALPLDDIAGLFGPKPLTPLPTAEPALLGLANFSGTVAPVFDLHQLLGLKPIKNPGWLAVARVASAAFAFEGFEGHLRVPQEDIVADTSGPQLQSVRMNGALRPIVRLPSIIAAIENRMSTPGSGRK